MQIQNIAITIAAVSLVACSKEKDKEAISAPDKEIQAPTSKPPLAPTRPIKRSIAKPSLSCESLVVTPKGQSMNMNRDYTVAAYPEGTTLSVELSDKNSGTKVSMIFTYITITNGAAVFSSPKFGYIVRFRNICFPWFKDDYNPNNWDDVSDEDNSNNLVAYWR